MFYCSLIYNFFQWKMMRTSYIISLATSFPPCFCFCASSQWTFFVYVTAKFKKKIRPRGFEGWMNCFWCGGRQKQDTHEEGRTWKPATCNLPTCCVVSIQFYLYWLPTAAAAAVLFFCRSLQSCELFSSLCSFFFHQPSIIYSHFDDRNSICMWKTLICFNDWVNFFLLILMLGFVYII